MRARLPKVADALQRRFDAALQALVGPLRGRVVLAAVSGGADSVALLLMAARAARRHGFALRAAHVQHGLRGAEAEADLALARGLCRAWGVPFASARLRLAKGPGLEARARAQRQRALARLARARGAKAVLLGHHQGDQAETVLMHLCRGCGLPGAAGLAPRTRLAGVDVDWLRPLLGFDRMELERLLLAAGVAWREDASNTDEALRRNRLRRRALPELEAAWPGAAQRLGAFARRAREAHEALQRLAEARLEAARGPQGIDLGQLAKADPYVRAEALRLACRGLKGLEAGLDEAATARLARLADAGRGACDLLKGWQAKAGKGRLRFCRVKQVAPIPRHRRRVD